MKLSAVILTKNEEKNIKRALKSIKFCDEIIVIDDNSTDKTADIAKKMAAKVYKSELNGDFSSQRNFAIGKAKGEWILYVDADEEATSELQNEIAQLLNCSIADKNDKNISNRCFYIKRRDYFWGKELKYGETQKVRKYGLIRLIKKGSGQYAGKVHEEYKTSLPVGCLHSFINHYPHQTINEFLQSVNNYSTLRAKELFAKKKKTNIFEIFLYPFSKFILTYFLKLGFLDGPPGFTYAFMMSFHSFLVRAKLYQYWEIDKK